MTQSGLSPALKSVLAELNATHGTLVSMEPIVGGVRYTFGDQYVVNLDDNGQDVVDSTNYESGKQNYDDNAPYTADPQEGFSTYEPTEPVGFDPVVLRMQAFDFVTRNNFEGDPLTNAARVARWLETGDEAQEAGQEATGAPSAADDDDQAQGEGSDPEAVRSAPEAEKEG